jgi:hypothetical protein
MFLCVLDASGAVLLYQNIRSKPEEFLQAVAPFREDLVVGVECIFTWYWLADLCAEEHIPFVNTHHQCNLPEPTRKIIYKANREGIVDHFRDPFVRKSIAIDLELVAHYDRLIRDLELDLVRTAKVDDPQTFFRLTSVPGIGKILAMTLLYEIHDIARSPRVQEFASYARLVKCAKESSGKRLGTGGAKIGNVHLKWALSGAAVLFLHGNPPAQRLLQRLRQKHGRAKALSILAHKPRRTVYYMLQRGLQSPLGTRSCALPPTRLRTSQL